MELTFVNQYGDSPPKRRRLAKACDVCRSRKKRCMHVPGASTLNDQGRESGDASDDPGPETTRPDNHSQRHVSPSPQMVRKFVSDLNPEATFLPRPTSITERDRLPNDDIGVWVDRREWDELVRQKNSALARDTTSDGAGAISEANRKPDPTAIPALLDIYFDRIHPILPLLDESDFRRSVAAGRNSETLTLAICLVAAKDPSAEPHLRLAGSPTTTAATPLSPRDFCSRIHGTVMAGLRDAPRRLEKITLIRALALASLHAEGPDGPEEATMCLTQAMHYTQTLGWHLGQQASVASGDDLTTKRLFWCLWALDRLNSTIYSRPVMMSDVDVAIEGFETDESGFPAFEAWLRVSRMLDKIISFYRPGRPLTMTGWEEDYPSFEEVAGEGRVWEQPQSVLATLHLFYLLVAVLSHRSRGVKYMPRGLASYVRQSLASSEIKRLMGSELLWSLHPLPILPYAISLALSVSYQHLRQSQLRHQQEDARDDFRLCCEVLQKLRRTWSSADVIATIAKKVLGELEKSTDLSSFRVSRYTASRDSPCTASLAKPSTLLDGVSHSVGTDGQTILNGIGSHGHGQQPQPPGTSIHSETLFDGMDDIFGTYLDPNYPLYLDDFALAETFGPTTLSNVTSA